MEEIRNLIENYKPSQQALDAFRSLRIVLLVGVAGAGKNTISQKLLESGHFAEIITSTTREPRYNDGVIEQDGVEYYFLTLDQASEKLAQGEYVEASLVHGENVYGVTATEILRIAGQGKIAMADVDIQGVEKYRAMSTSVSAIFLLPPNYESWRQRMRNRYQTDEEFEREWPERRDSAIRELETALSRPYYHFVINDDIDKAVEACASIVRAGEVFHRKDDEKRLVARDILDDLKNAG